jgi:hypothetical protein
MVKHATVQFKRTKYDNQMRYIHKYYLPQELKPRIFPTDIDGIGSCFVEGEECKIWEGRIPKKLPECLIHYQDIGMEKRIDGDTVRKVLEANAAYLNDCLAELTAEEDRAALNLNAWLVEWEKELLNYCIQQRNTMEQQVRSGDSWLTDYEIDVEVEFYVRDEDPYSEANMPDASRDDIDGNTALLCTMKLLVQDSIFHYGNGENRGIGDNLDHNDGPRGSRKEEI